MPLHHTFECTAGFLFPISRGSSIAFCDGIRHIANNIKEYEITIMVSLPILYENFWRIVIGKVLPGLEVKIKDENDEGIGELLVKGPTVMLGYYQNEEATKEIIDESGWLNTGDLAKIDKEGFIFITGRKKYVIV